VPALRLSRFGRMSRWTRGATGVRSNAAVSLRADLATWQVVKYLPAKSGFVSRATGGHLPAPLAADAIRSERPAHPGERVRHLQVEQRTVIGERRGYVAEHLQGDGTVQLGAGDHVPGQGAGRETAAYAVLVAPAGELPAQGSRRSRFDALGVDLVSRYSAR
jgi:hypothetical protein